MPLKVMMLGWELPPFNSGGLGEACLGLARALSRKGVKITFVLPQKVDIKADFMDVVFADIGEDVNKLQTSYMSYLEWIKKYGKGFSCGPFDFIGGALKYAENIKDIAKKYSSDIIHAHDWLTYPAGMVAKSIINKPLIAHVHSTEIDRTGGHFPHPVVYEIEKDGFSTADKVISVSQYTKNILIKNYIVNPGKVEVVYNAIDKFDTSQLPPALNSMKECGYKIVLFLGRITLMKGPEYFVRAAKMVSDFYPKVIFVVVGTGDMQEFMISEAARLGVLEKFVFTGFLRGSDRDRIYQAADIYVMPSVSEPFGITTLEAIANGSPVIVSKQSGVSELFKHVLKVDFWDTEEIANKIIAVLKYGALGIDLRKESLKEIKNVNWSNSADKCIGIYNQLVS